MFFNKIKKYASLFLLTYCIIPLNVLASTKYLVPGGDNIGIEIKTNGVIVVGSYDGKTKSAVEKSGLMAGDIIVSVNGNNITTVDEMIEIINETKGVDLNIKYKRNEKINSTTLSVYNDSGIYKTGLYVKDSVTGIGTLSYIDPETKTFGALGHEILEKNTGQILEVKSGTIFESSVTDIERSETGTPGSKTAEFFSDKIKGNILENTSSGIFGKYIGDINQTKKYNVAEISDIKLGKAYIRTVLSGNEVKDYEINILKINKEEKTNKNILFEITDSELLSKTGGVVQGMSGSPIIQNDYIIGAVNYVLVDEPTKGYGIYIKHMLKEANGD